MAKRKNWVAMKSFFRSSRSTATPARGPIRSMGRALTPRTVATQKGETEDYPVADHVEAIQGHTFPEIVDVVVANDTPRELGSRFLGEPVVDGGLLLDHVAVVSSDLTDADHPVRHDPDKLARSILDVYEGKSTVSRRWARRPAVGARP
mgnify:CR=1 FL=1